MAKSQAPENEAQIVNEVTTIISIFTQIAKSQGFAIMLLCLYAYRSETKQERQDLEIKTCQAEKLDYYTKANDRLLNAFEANTKAINDLRAEIYSNPSKKLKP